jgi:hypothetical protein
VIDEVRDSQWFREWLAVVESNVSTFADEPRVVALARGWPFFATRRVARFIRARIPYEFHGEDHVVADWNDCLERGYGACADGSAIAAALFYLAGARRLHFCYEKVPAFRTYAHARMVVSGRFVEPWPEQRRPEARECSTLVDVLAVLHA